MHPILDSLGTILLRRCDPERAHGLALRLIAAGLAGGGVLPADPRLKTSVLGLDFANPVGLAAGFDKNAGALRGLMRLGFGFIEAGTVTPRPQAGNPRPRIFRLEEDAAVINRMGFPNGGLDAFRARLAALGPHHVPVGANIGINKEGADPERDYPLLVAALAPIADYLVVNVSSPNTPGLRDLQSEERLRSILQAVQAGGVARPPLLVKLSPDMSDAGLEAAVEVAIECGAQGLIVTNTTLSRPASLRSVHAKEAGGLSGAPLTLLARAAIRRVRMAAGKRLVVIGAGGIASGADALGHIRAGADLVQIYTGFIYGGPALIPRVAAELSALLGQQGFSNVADAVGVDCG